MKIAMSSGHSKYLSGAVGPSPWGLHEHTEAVALVNQTAIEMRALGLEVVTYEDTVSKNVSDNLDRLISWHNQQVRDVDLSIHLNASEPTQGVRGHECWYTSDKGKQIAQAIVGPVCAAAGFKNRGVKHTDDLAWLNGTAMPSCLLEICFVDARGDVDLYQAQGAFGAICSAIAGALAGSESAPGPEPAPGAWIDDITATVFGGAADNENSAYPPYDLLNDTDLYLSLPYKFPGERPMVEVMNPANGEIRAAPIRDVGPWMIDDDYFRRGTRPIAETCYEDKTPLPSGPNAGEVPTNDAGIDLSPALADELGIDGKGTVSFRVMDGTQPAPEPPATVAIAVTTSGPVTVTVNGVVVS